MTLAVTVYIDLVLAKGSLNGFRLFYYSLSIFYGKTGHSLKTIPSFEVIEVLW